VESQVFPLFCGVILLLLSLVVLADAGFVHNKTAMLHVTIKERLLYMTIVFFFLSLTSLILLHFLLFIFIQHLSLVLGTNILQDCIASIFRKRICKDSKSVPLTVIHVLQYFLIKYL